MTDTTYQDDWSRDAARPTEAMKRNWGWMLAIGIVLILTGLLAFALPVVASIAVEAMIGAAFLISGVMQGVHAVRAEGWRARAISIASALLYVVGAGLLLLNPLAGLVALTLVMLSVIAADGVMRVVIGARMRPEKGWGWMIASGVVSVLLAIALFLMFPAVSLTLLGVLLGISFVIEGAAFTAAALAARRTAN